MAHTVRSESARRKDRIAREARDVALRTSMVYALFAAAWILVSGLLVLRLPGPLEGEVEILKGLLFVVVTSAILFLVLYRWAERHAVEAHHAEGAERVLRQVVETVPIGVALLNDSAEITFLNPAAEELLGTSLADAAGQPLDQAFGSTYGDPVVGVGELLRDGSTDMLSVDGEEAGARRVFASAAQIDPGIPGSGWVIAIGDLTDTHRERRRYETLSRGYRVVSEVATAVARARDERQVLTQLCEQVLSRSSLSGAWATVFDPATGTHEIVASEGLGEGARAAAAAMVGALGASSRGMPALLTERELFVSNDLTHEKHSAWSTAVLSEGFRSSAAFTVGGPDSIRASVTLLSRAPGFFDDDQLGLIEVLRDEVSFALERIGLDRKRLAAEEALEASEEAYRGVFERHPQPMFVVDRDTRSYLAANEAAVRKYGYSPDEFAGLTVYDLRPPGDRAQIDVEMERNVSGVTNAGVWTHIDKSGREFPVEIWVEPVRWFGRNADLVLVQEVATMH